MGYNKIGGKVFVQTEKAPFLYPKKSPSVSLLPKLQLKALIAVIKSQNANIKEKERKIVLFN